MRIDRTTFLMFSAATLCIAVANILNAITIKTHTAELRALRIAVEQYEGTVRDAD